VKRNPGLRAEGGRYVQTWPRVFDYLYLVGPPVANPMPDVLDEVMHARRITSIGSGMRFHPAGRVGEHTGASVCSPDGANRNPGTASPATTICG